MTFFAQEVTKAKALSVSEEQRKEVVAQAESHKKADKKGSLISGYRHSIGWQPIRF